MYIYKDLPDVSCVMQVFLFICRLLLFDCPSKCLQKLRHLRLRQDLHKQLWIYTDGLTSLFGCDLSGCLFLIEDILKDLGVVLTVFIQNMRVPMPDYVYRKIRDICILSP